MLVGVRDGALHQLTKDHSYVQEQVDAGFRTDRVLSYEFLEARYPIQRSRLRVQWRKEMEEEHEKHKSYASRRQPANDTGIESPIGQRVE